MASELDRKSCWPWSETGIKRLEEFISKEQLDIIRLAYIGLGIYVTGYGWLEQTMHYWAYWDSLDGHPTTKIYRRDPHAIFISSLSFSKLCTELFSWKSEDACYLLYVVLVGVGVDEMLLKEVGFNCDTEIDIEFLHQKYPKFSVLLAVGNMVMSMSDSEFKEFCCSEEYFSRRYKSRCNFVAYSKPYNQNYTHLSDFLCDLKEEYVTYFDSYFDSLRQKTVALQNTLQKGMGEGFVSLNIIKMVIYGPPFVGKTAFKHLLLNKPPPLKHNSTPIAARPIQAIERIAAGDKTWEEVSEVDLLHMLSDAMENTTSSSLEDVSDATSSVLLDASPFQLAGGKEVGNEEELPSDVIKKKATQSLHNVPKIDSLKNISSSSLEDVPVATNSLVASPQKAFLDKTTASVSRKIIEQLASSKKRKGSQKLLESTWIYLLDSGGQPQFFDLLHMFMRDNSLYIIVMKVTESLHDKPVFIYSLNGSPVSVPQKMTMTNFQIIKRFIRSVAVASKKKPAFAIVATNCDHSKFRRFIGLDEKLKTKNKVLQECLSEFLDLFIFYNRNSNELIFPVDNLCRWNRQKISADIRSRLLCSRSDISFNVKIPIRWYVFDLSMKKEASKETHGIISLESCFNIGRKFGMNESEVKHCLDYLDSMRLCVYYPNIIPHVVFTSPQFLIDCLSNIVRVSFVDDLKQILPVGVSLSDETVLSLKRDGVFDESLLDSLGLTFLPNLFSKFDLLFLLQHFRLISPIKAACDVHQYFIPVLLPAERLTEVQKAIFGSSLDPLIITFKGQLVLQGLFPALIVSLLSRKREPLFYIDSFSSDFPKQLRHAVKLYSEDLFGSVFLCEDHKWIEVYFTGPRQHCCLLRKVILEGLSASAGVLEYDEEALDVSALVHCNRKHIIAANDNVPHPITLSEKMNPPAIGCSMESGLPTISMRDIDERKSFWLIDSHTHSLSVDISNVLPEGTLLNQSHASIILKAINDVVLELDVLGIHLGLSNAVIQEIKTNSPYEVQTRRKDIIITWLKTGTADRSSLISALELVGRNDVAAAVKHLPII